MSAWMVLATLVLGANEVTFSDGGGAAAVGQICRVSVVPTQMPPSRTTVVLRPKGFAGETVEFTWDPALDPKLARTADLPCGLYEVQIGAEPHLVVTDQVVIDQSFSGGSSCTGLICTVDNRLALGAGKSPSTSPAFSFSSSARPGLDQRLQSLSMPSTSELALRSIEGDAAKVLDDTLRLLAQIALERARSRSTALLLDRVRTLVCDEFHHDLTIVPSPGPGTSAITVTLKLKHTCSALQSLRFEELATVGQAMGRALASDLAEVLFDVLDKGAAAALTAGSAELRFVQTIAGELRTIALEMIQTGNTPDLRRLQTTLLVAARELADAIKSSPNNDRLKAFAAGVVAAGECGKGSTCTPAELARLAFAEAPEAQRKLAGDAAALALEIFQPNKKTNRAVLTSHLFLLLAQGARAALPVPSANSDARDWALGVALDGFSNLVAAVSSGDLSQAVQAGARLFQAVPGMGSDVKPTPEAARMLRLVGGLSNYAQVYKNTANETAEAAREARKAALESLIDSMTDRRGREQDLVVSLGVATGLGGYLSYSVIDYSHTKWFQLSLPMGIAIQRLPSQNNFVSWLVQFSFFDLGLYLPTQAVVEAPSPIQALHLGFQGAVTFGTPSDTFAVGLSLRYVPSMNEPGPTYSTAVGTVQVGFFVAYYVPFLDFN